MNIKPIALICILLIVTMLFSSCEAVDELTGKGIWGWLGIDDPFDKDSSIPPTVSSPTPPQSFLTTPGQTILFPDLTEQPTALPGTVITEIPVYPTYSQLLSEYQAIDMKNKSLMIACPSGSKVLTWQNAEMFNQILSDVNNKFSLNMFINPQDEKQLSDDLANSAENDGYVADVLYIPLSLAAKYAKEGFLAEIDPTKISTVNGAYDSDINDALTVDGHMYGLSSSIFTSYENNVVIYLNTDLLKRLDIELDVYKSVEDSEWTWEMVYMICSAAKLKDDGSFKIAGSLWNENKTKALLYSSCGENLSYEDVYGDEVSNLKIHGNEQFLGEMAVFMNSGFISGEEASSAFYNGELLMMVGNVSELRKHYNSFDSYAILPMPKVNKSQSEYITVCDPDNTYVFAFPKSAKNNEECLYFINILSEISRFSFKNDFLESLYSIYIRQSQSITMLGIDSKNRFVQRIFLYGNEKLLKEVVTQF